MIDQYPHFLFAFETSEATRDDDGNYTIPTSGWVLKGKCREEPNGKGSVVNGPDGRSVVYASNIYSPKSTLSVNAGCRVKVTNDDDGNDARVEGIVLRHYPGQFNNRLWV